MSQVKLLLLLVQEGTLEMNPKEGPIFMVLEWTEPIR